MKLSSRTSLLVAATVASLATICSPRMLLGVTTTYVGPNGGLFNDPANWNNGVPGPNDKAVINGSSNGTIDLGGTNPTIDTLIIPLSSRTFLNGVLHTAQINPPNGGSVATATIGFASTIAAAQDGTNIRLPGAIGLPFFGAFNMQGVFGNGTGGGNFGFVGAARLRGANTYTGSTIGEFLIEGDGSIRNSSLYDLNIGSLLLGNPSAGNVDRLNDSAEVRLRLAEFRIGLTTPNATPELVGTLTPAAADNTVTANSATVSFAALNRTGGSFLRTSTDATGWIRFRSAPTMVGSVVPGVVANREFATYDSTGLRALTAAETVPTIPAGASAANVRAASAQVVSSDSSINTLSLRPGVGVDMQNASLTIATGLQFVSDASSPARETRFSGNGRLVFANEGIINQVNTGTRSQVIDVPITAGSLTVAGSGSLSAATVELRQPNQIPGGINVASGRVVVATPAAAGSGPIRISFGQFGIVDQSQTLANPFIFDAEKSPALDSYLTGTGLSIPAASEMHLTGPLSGGGFVSTGPGRLRISGNNSFSAIWFSGSHVQVDSTLSASEELIVEGTRLSGVGTINGIARLSRGLAITQPSVVAPGQLDGAGVGRLTIGSLPIRDTDTLEFDLAGAGQPGIDYDQLVMLSQLRLDDPADTLSGGRLDLNIAPAFNAPLGSQFTIIDDQFTGAITGTFGGLPQGAVFFADGQAFQINYLGGDGNDVVLTAVVPEPSSLILIFAPLAAIAFSGSRRRRV